MGISEVPWSSAAWTNVWTIYVDTSRVVRTGILLPATFTDRAKAAEKALEHTRCQAQALFPGAYNVSFEWPGTITGSKVTPSPRCTYICTKLNVGDNLVSTLHPDQQFGMR